MVQKPSSSQLCSTGVPGLDEVLRGDFRGVITGVPEYVPEKKLQTDT